MREEIEGEHVSVDTMMPPGRRGGGGGGCGGAALRW